MRRFFYKLLNSPPVKFSLTYYRRFHASRLNLLAAGLAYYAAFSLGPLTLILAGFLGGFLRSRPDLASQYQAAFVVLLEQALPFEVDVARMVSQSFDNIVSQLSDGAVFRNLISFLTLLWASTNFFTVLQLALELIFEVQVARNYWRKRLVSLFLLASVAIVIASEVVVLFVSSLINRLLTLTQVVLDNLGFYLPASSFSVGQGLFAELFRFAIAITAFSFCFRYLPKRSSGWLAAVLGASFSVISIRVVQVLFGHYFNLERFSVIYGFVTSLLVILLWLYLSLLLFLMGAVLTAVITERIAQRLEPKDLLS